MKRLTTRFHGEVSVQEREILVTEWPILGFEAWREWVLLPLAADCPWLVLQAVDWAPQTFFVVDPGLFYPGYRPDPAVVQGCGDPNQWAVMAICRFRAGHRPTANLRSPLVFNRQTRHGGQFVHGQWPAALEEAPLALVQEAAPCSS